MPGFTSHLIVSVTLAIPVAILGETALSFLGLGIQPPAVSWVLLRTGDLVAVAQQPWRLIPAIFVIGTVLSSISSATVCAMLPILFGVARFRFGTPARQMTMENANNVLVDIQDPKVQFFLHEGPCTRSKASASRFSRGKRSASSARAARASRSRRRRSWASSRRRREVVDGHAAEPPENGASVRVANGTPPSGVGDSRYCGKEVSHDLPGADDLLQPGPHLGNQIIGSRPHPLSRG